MTYTAEDLRSIAEFHKIIKNYKKMVRLLNDPDHRTKMDNCFREFVVFGKTSYHHGKATPKESSSSET